MSLKRIDDQLSVDPSRVLSVHTNEALAGKTMVNVDMGSYTANYTTDLTVAQVHEKLRLKSGSFPS